MASGRAEPTLGDERGVMQEFGGWDTHLHVFDQRVPVQPGHYQPAHRPLEAIEREAELRLGVKHLVLVQPSVYGQDHSVLLSALRQERGRHRGVVVPGNWLGRQSERELDALHALGIRGARLNCVSPQGEGADPVEIGGRVHALMPVLKARGWHLQWYITPNLLPWVAKWHEGSGVVAVLDHLGGMTAALTSGAWAASEPLEELASGLHAEAPAQAGLALNPQARSAWQALAKLAAQKAWIKLSGWYRLQSRAPYQDLQPLIVALDKLFQDRLLWGSDWPHTYFKPESQPDLLSLWSPVVGALGEARAAEILGGAGRLYQ